MDVFLLLDFWAIHGLVNDYQHCLKAALWYVVSVNVYESVEHIALWRDFVGHGRPRQGMNTSPPR